MVRDCAYWERVRARAAELNSDGCSGVADIYLDCCYEHDIAYRTGKAFEGDRTTRAQDDARFRECIQEHSSFGRFSPVSWWRWLGVRILGRGRKNDA